MRTLHLILLIALLSSCGTRQQKAGAEAESQNPTSLVALEQEYLRKGAEIVGLSQAELLKNVAAAMGLGGPASAVDFCNIHALSIKDSLSTLYDCELRRISLKFRNPADKAVSGTEKEVLAKYQEVSDSGETPEALLYLFEDRAEYYHPIHINNGACLLCHGTPGEQIVEETMEMIAAHYPGDLATGYKMDELRGAWKITFRQR